MDFEHVLVVGAGQMGGGIAQVVAASGRRVSLHDAAPGAVERGLETMRKSLTRLADKGGADPDEVLARVAPADELVAADLMIEAVVEDAQVKEAIFRAADAVFPPEAILASNTSSIPITSLAAATSRPDRVIGMHFFNPVPVLKLVEVIRGLDTSDETAAAITALAVDLGKTPAEARDFPGFVSNRILMPFINEAAYALLEGVAEAEAIDTIATLGFAHPMGPLALADLIGLDTCVAIMEVLHRGPRRPEVRAVSSPAAIRAGGPPRPQERPRLLHLLGRRALRLLLRRDGDTLPGDDLPAADDEQRSGLRAGAVARVAGPVAEDEDRHRGVAAHLDRDDPAGARERRVERHRQLVRRQPHVHRALDDLRVRGEQRRRRLVAVGVERGAPRPHDLRGTRGCARRRCRSRARRRHDEHGSESQCLPHQALTIVRRVDFELSPEQREIQALAREFARQEIEPNAAAWDREHRFPREVFAQLAELGLMGTCVPEEYGGAGADFLSYILVLEELSRGDAGVGVTVAVHTSAATLPLLAFGTDEQRARFVPPLARGEQIGAFALTEPEAGSDAGALRTRADADGDGWRITGAKQWITNGRYAGTFILFARTDPDTPGAAGVSAFVLDAEHVRITRDEEKLGLNSSATNDLVVEGAHVGRDRLLHEEGKGFQVAMATLDGGRIGIAAQAVGIAQAAYDVAREYAKERHAFGQAIARFQAIQHKLADMSTEIDAARLLVYRAAVLKDRGEPHTEAGAKAKLYASEMARRQTAEAIQILGGYGYTKEFPVERYYRDAKITEIYEGTSEIQRLVIARSILGLQTSSAADATRA